MKGRAPHTACRGLLPIGEVVGIEQAKRFPCPVDKVGPVAHEGLHPADVDIGEIERRVSVFHPVGQRHARPARGLDADRIEPGGDEIAAQFRCLAQVIGVVGGEAFGTIEKGMDTGALQQRHTVDRLFQDGFEMVEILGQLVKAETGGNAVHAPGFGDRFKRAEQDLSCVFLVIGAFIRHPQGGQLAQAGDVFSDDVEVFAGLQRHVDVVLTSQFRRPHAGAIDHEIRRDKAGFAIPVALPGYARNGPLAAAHGFVDLRHPDMFERLGAAHSCALGQRQRDVARIALAVRGQVDRPGKAIGVELGVERAQVRL